MTILEMALQLGKTISGSEEYIAMKRIEDNLIADTEAQKVIQEYQTLQQSYQRMQMTGQTLREEQLARLREVEDKAMQNDLVRKYYESRLKFHELVEQVNAKIQEGMVGTPPGQSCHSGG